MTVGPTRSFVLFDPEPVVLFLKPQTFGQHGVDVRTGFHEQTKVVIARRRHRFAALGQQDELTVIRPEQMTGLPHHLGVKSVPSEDSAVERVDSMAEIPGEGADGKQTTPYG